MSINEIKKSIAQVALTTAVQTLYTHPANARSYAVVVENIMATETDGSEAALSVYVVPALGTAAAGNAIVYERSIPANTVFDWQGEIVIDEPGTMLQAVIATGDAVTITVSGIERRQI